MLLSGVKSAKPGCPCLAVAILCAVVGLAGGGAAVACGAPDSLVELHLEGLNGE